MEADSIEEVPTKWLLVIIAITVVQAIGPEELQFVLLSLCIVPLTELLAEDLGLPEALPPT